MGSSRASTTAGRRRTAQRAAAGRGGATSRSPAARPPKAKPRPRPKPKAKAGRPSSKAKPRAAKRKAPAKPARARQRRATPKPRSTSRPRWGGRLLVALGFVVLLAGAFQFWFRDSSLVALEEIAVVGMEGPEESAVGEALRETASGMTTLNVDQDALNAAVASFPTVVGVSVDTDFPHGATIEVSERPPVLIAKADGRTLPVAGDGTILAGVETGDSKLPKVAVAELPARGRLQDDALELAKVVGAAPVPLRELVRDVSIGEDEGVQVTLEGDIPVYFGGSDHADEKWTAAAAVLAQPKLDQLTYLDVRVPERPAIGGAAPPVTATTTETGETPP